VNIFTRSLDDNLASLVKQVDKKVAANKGKQMSSFVVLLTDDPDEAEGQLKKFAKKHGLKTPLTIVDSIAGPETYKIAKDAEVTVHLWVGAKEVKANHVFAKGKLDKKGVTAVIADTAKILN
tara:strand:+ start:26 stop:391 length:366 start_codon:yes stop_codon:yes gene_type:complete